MIDQNIIPQIEVFSYFRLKFFIFNYHLIWEQQDWAVYFYFPQVLRETDFLPFIIKIQNKTSLLQRSYHLSHILSRTIVLQNNLKHLVIDHTHRPIIFLRHPLIMTAKKYYNNILKIQRKTHLKTNKTPQEDQYEDAPQEQPIA